MDQLRAWYPHYDETLAQIRRFWDGAGRYLITVHSSAQSAYKKNFDEAAVRALIPPALQAQAALSGPNLPVVTCDWGTTSTAKYWGGREYRSADYIYVDPVAQTVAEALALDPLPVDHPTMDAYKGVARWRALCAELDTDALWLRTPDFQGVLNTAGLVMNQEALMLAMFDKPDKVHAYLDKVCDFLIAWWRWIDQQTGGKICGNVWPYTFLPADMGVGFTEDLMPLVSARTYRNFGIPYLRRIEAELGPLHIHCCGDWGRHAPNLKASGLRIRAMEFHHPATTLEELAPLADEVVFIPYILLHKQSEFTSTVDYYRWLITHAPQGYRFWFACADDSPEMQAFAAEYGS